MKFTTSSLLLAAATAVIAVPAPQSDGGHGIPPAATITNPHAAAAASATTSSSVNVHTSVPPAAASNPHAVPTTSSAAAGATTSPAADVPAASGTTQPDIQIPYSDSNALFTLSPADPKAWATVAAPGVFNVTARFSIAGQDTATATFAPPQPFAGLQVYAYQRSDGGIMGLYIDGVATARIDYYNKTAGPNDPPVLLWQNPHLVRAHHVVEFKNMVDTRVGKAGQFNIDHVVITAAADPPRSTSTESTPAAPSSTDSVPDSTETVPSSLPTTSTPVSTPQQGAGAGAAAESQQTPPPNAATGARAVSGAVVAGVTVVAALVAMS